jgi:hypothetical protein
MATKTAINEVLSDPNFDSSLAASRLRLEQSLAIGTEIALRGIMTGLLSDEDTERLGKLASMYARIASTLPTTDAKEVDDETLEKIAGT